MSDLRVDDNHKIYWVSDDWDEFARNNSAPDLTADAVIGKLLFSFITGDVTRMFYDVGMLQARTQKKPYVLHYRCDAPGEARLMTMRIEYTRNEGWLLSNKINNTKIIDSIVYFEYAADSEISRCSICNQIRLNGEWQDLLHRPKILGSRQTVHICYSICQQCEQLSHMAA